MEAVNDLSIVHGFVVIFSLDFPVPNPVKPKLKVHYLSTRCVIPKLSSYS